MIRELAGTPSICIRTGDNMKDANELVKDIIGFLDRFADSENAANITASMLTKALENDSGLKKSDYACYYCDINRYTGTTPFH